MAVVKRQCPHGDAIPLSPDLAECKICGETLVEAFGEWLTIADAASTDDRRRLHTLPEVNYD